MIDIKEIIKAIDEFLERKYQEVTTPVEINPYLESRGLLNDSKSSPGLPLRKILRSNRIPHAYQIGVNWQIPHSKVSSINAKPTRELEIENKIVSKEKSLSKTPMAKTSSKVNDEQYVLDLCDKVLGIKSARQHRFDFLIGDSGVKLPVDSFYPTLNLVIEYRERQHTESVGFFDKPERMTVSGVHRGEQRRVYDERRRKILPEHNIELIEISYNDFNYDRQKRIIRNPEKDGEVIRHKLNRFIK